GRHRLAQVMQTFCPPRASLAASRPWHARAAMHATDVRANHSSALGLQHRPGAVLRPALAAPELLQLGRMRLVERDAVVVGQLFAGLDPAGRFDEDLVVVALALFVFLDHGLAVGFATVVDPARDVALGVGVDDVIVVEGEQEGMAVLVLVAVFLVHLVVGAEHALVADDALALLDGFGGENAVAVDGRKACGDLLLGHCVVPDDGGKPPIMAHPAGAPAMRQERTRQAPVQYIAMPRPNATHAIDFSPRHMRQARKSAPMANSQRSSWP